MKKKTLKAQIKRVCTEMYTNCLFQSRVFKINTTSTLSVNSPGIGQGEYWLLLSGDIRNICTLTLWSNSNFI